MIPSHVRDLEDSPVDFFVMSALSCSSSRLRILRDSTISRYCTQLRMLSGKTRKNSYSCLFEKFEISRELTIISDARVRLRDKNKNMPVECSSKCGKNAILKRPKTCDALCKECFFYAFETEIHHTIVNGKLFKVGNKVAIGASGGKDSTVLAYVLKLLNERYNYGLDLFLLSIDEGITGYRDDSLKTVEQNRDDYKMPLKILSYKDLYGWTMDEIVAQIGRKNNCTFCGVFRRQALDRGAALLNVDCIATGHNADDIAETVLMNILRGDIARLSRCTSIITSGGDSIMRCKPLKYTYEKEIVMYAYFKKLVYFSTECVFAPNAYRGYARTFLKDLEKVRSSSIIDIIHSGERMIINTDTVKMPVRGKCSRCGFVSSQEICKACILLEGLNRGLPKLGIGKSHKALQIVTSNISPDLI